MEPMVTPVDEKLSIDHQALERLINHIIEGRYTWNFYSWDYWGSIFPLLWIKKRAH